MGLSAAACHRVLLLVVVDSNKPRPT